jgi:hypothetical protein
MRPLLLFCCFLLPTSSVPAPAAELEALRPNDFAYGIEVRVTDDPVQTCIVPEEIYRGVVRADLGDVRVFNREGHLVPHAVRSLIPETQNKRTTDALPAFPLRGTARESVDDLTVRIERDEGGSILHVRGAVTEAEVAGESAPGSDVRAYLFDTSALDRPVHELLLTWTEPRERFLRRARVHGSEDLVQWRSLGSGSVAFLDHAGRRLSRRTIVLDGTRARFLRLSWEAGTLPLLVTGARATTIAGFTPPSERLGVTVEATRDAADGGQYDFDLGGVMPVDQVRIGLPEKNTLAQVLLESAAAAAGPYERRHAGMVFRVNQDGHELTSEPIAVVGSRHRFWRLRVVQKGGGLGGGTPTLRASWTPEQLLFVARGEGPFIIAHGNTRAEPGSFSAASLLALAPSQDPAKVPRQSVRMVRASFVLAGQSALELPAETVHWSVWLVWAVLVSGVGLLGWMAWKLLRSLNAPSD